MSAIERILMVVEDLSEVDSSEPDEVGAAIDQANAELREIAQVLAAGEQGAIEAKAAGPLLSPDCDATFRGPVLGPNQDDTCTRERGHDGEHEGLPF